MHYDKLAERSFRIIVAICRKSNKTCNLVSSNVLSMHWSLLFSLQTQQQKLFVACGCIHVNPGFYLQSYSHRAAVTSPTLVIEFYATIATHC